MALSTSDPVLRRMHACVEAGVPANLLGPPGGGKTERVKAYAKARQAVAERWLLSRCEPIDLKPRIYHEGSVVVGVAPEVERLSVAVGLGKIALLFIDEFNRSERAVEGAALDLIDNPPAGVRVIAACNPPSRGQAARVIESAAANRFCHLTTVVDARAWSAAQIAGWTTSADSFDAVDFTSDEYQAADQRARAMVAGYIRGRPDALHKEPDNPKEAGGAWPSPRSWEHARKLYAVALYFGLDADDTLALVAGCVGDGAGGEFLAFTVEAGLVDPEDLLADPASYTPPLGRVDLIVAAMGAVAGALHRKVDGDRWKAAWALAKRVEECSQMDAALIASDVFQEVYTRLADADKTRPEKIAAKLLPPGRMMTRKVAEVLVAVAQKSRAA